MEWISVKDRLPKKNGRYLCYRPLHYMKILKMSAIGIYYYGRMENEGDRKGFYFFDSDYGDVEISNVTHWMELPEPPKEIESEN